MDSSQTNPPTESFAWGGFLKKAMEGMEQQLDRVLENPPPKAREAAAAAKKEVMDAEKNRNSGGSSGRLTLQERLAASVAKSRTGSPKSSTQAEDGSNMITPVTSSGDLKKLDTNGVVKEKGSSSPARTSTPKVPTSPISKDIEALDTKDPPSRIDTPDIPVIFGEELLPQITLSADLPVDTMKVEPPSITEPPNTEAQTSLSAQSTPIPPNTDPATADLILQLGSDLAACEARRIEETQQATERINSLEEKLKALAQTTLEASKETATNPNATPLERKLADRESKIALLLDEGEKLAKIELNLMTTIKSLRVKQKEDEKTTSAALARAEKVEKQLVDLKAQLKRANEIEKKNTERLKGMYKIEAANEALRREKEAAQATISTLQTSLAEAVERADDAVSKIQTEALEQERMANAELRERLERLGTELSLSEQQFKSEIAELKGRLEREQLSSKAMKADLTSEINNLECKLEVLRTQAEESSTSATSSAQAKLLRQIEMLQTQHMIASQNWQRIEGSLQVRNESLEEDKIDLIRRWEDEKKKIKEAIDAKRAVQTQLDSVKREIRQLESEVLKAQSDAQTLREATLSLETRLADQEASFAKEKMSLQESFETTLETRLKEEKQKWEEEQTIYTPPPLSATFPQFSSILSRPSAKIHKSVSPQPDFVKPRIPSRQASYGDIPQLRRPSRHLGTSFEISSPASTPTLTIPPPVPPEDDEEREFISGSRGESPRNTVVDAVSISASTGTAGPSVNIIERMSAAVRRLESDLAATKEEMSRSIKQRDEAREECVKLMSEVEEKRTLDDNVKALQSRYDDLENRYNEALILLGEKSERVEELQMDIVDLKEGYQAALQRLVDDK